MDLSLSREVKFHPRGVSTALADPGLPVDLRLDLLNYFCCVVRCDPLVEVISQLNVGDAGELVCLDIISDEVLEVQLRIHQTFQIGDELETFLVGDL